MKIRDKVVLQKIIRFTDEIAHTSEEYSLTLEKLNTMITPKNAIAMCVLQIGELAGVLSDDVKQKYPGVPWRLIKATRNIAAHNYGAFDLALLWETTTRDVPALKAYCEHILLVEPVDE
ncbi:MAG: DUF86 domain-containing protein [Oscillospiraceae bacterium]|jgi:uncharacterized protein with HEPN domain|nr:DUF86 domain-containing protein [Oscillospiraceae bacterium]